MKHEAVVSSISWHKFMGRNSRWNSDQAVDELREKLNAIYYLHFLETELGPLLVETPLKVRHKIWLQLDGASAHYAQVIR